MRPRGSERGPKRTGLRQRRPTRVARVASAGSRSRPRFLRRRSSLRSSGSSSISRRSACRARPAPRPRPYPHRYPPRTGSSARRRRRRPAKRPPREGALWWRSSSRLGEGSLHPRPSLSASCEAGPGYARKDGDPCAGCPSRGWCSHWHVFVEAARTAWAHFLPPERLALLHSPAERWERAAPHEVTLVAEHAGELVAFAVVRRSMDTDADPWRTGELDTFYALPSSWGRGVGDRKSTRLNSSHVRISY